MTQEPRKSGGCYTCVWIYERLARQLAEPSSDDQAAMQDVLTAIEESRAEAPHRTGPPERRRDE